MAQKQNELYIGNDQLNMEGRNIKHPALIRKYANINAKKIHNDKIGIIGLDLETDAATGDLKLLGFYDGQNYNHYVDNFLAVIFMYVRYCKSQMKHLACWNRLDPFIILKQFLLRLDENEQNHALNRFGKVSGEWDRNNSKWRVKPVCEIQVQHIRFGIKNAIRSSIQFFWHDADDDEARLNTVWLYDVAQLYPNSLEKEALARNLPYYSKVDKSAHIVDWDKFDKDAHYRNEIVLKSNYLDARACYDLSLIIQDDFYNAFNYYPRTLISQGSLARAAITAVLNNKYMKEYPDEKELGKKVHAELASIGLINYKDTWVKEFGKELWKDINCIFTESYSGGYIEAIRYGYTKEGWFSDIASAYPAIINKLYDLRNCTIRSGVGEPPKPKQGYCFIRGTVDIPSDVNFHPVTIKHPISKETNIRAVGEYRASYTYNERMYLRGKGATFKDEEWHLIETEGKLSPLAEVCMDFINLRKELIAKGSSSQHMAKIAANSIYGILFEAVDTFIELEHEKTAEVKTEWLYRDLLTRYKRNINLESVKGDIKYYMDKHANKLVTRWHDANSVYTPDIVKDELKHVGIYLESDHPADIMMEIEKLYINDKKAIELSHYIKTTVERNGYRAGEFWNPCYASIITSETRLLMAMAADAIEQRGGKVILLMTDSILWEGDKDMIPSKYVRDEKTLGYFETPEKVHDIVCLGSGRYGFKKENGYYQAKRRGLNAVNMHDPDGIIIDDFNWATALDIMKKTKKDKIDIKVRTLISAGLVLHNHMFRTKDLGRIIEETRTVDAIVGKNKRFYSEDIKNPHLLSTSLIETIPIELDSTIFGKVELLDHTLVALRNQMKHLEVKTSYEKRRAINKRAVNKYRYNNSVKIQKSAREIYGKLREIGYSREEAAHMRNWSMERLKIKLFEDGKEL